MRLLLAVLAIAVAAVPAVDTAVAKKAATYGCSDGVDNDGDGFVDADDSACWAPYVDTEVPECSDGIDNDGNGDIDLADEACLNNPAGLIEQDIPATECTDGYDNDLDGKIDDADPDCNSLSFPESESRVKKPRP